MEWLGDRWLLSIYYLLVVLVFAGPLLGELYDCTVKRK